MSRRRNRNRFLNKSRNFQNQGNLNMSNNTNSNNGSFNFNFGSNGSTSKSKTETKNNQNSFSFDFGSTSKSTNNGTSFNFSVPQSEPQKNNNKGNNLFQGNGFDMFNKNETKKEEKQENKGFSSSGISFPSFGTETINSTFNIPTQEPQKDSKLKSNTGNSSTTTKKQENTKENIFSFNNNSQKENPKTQKKEKKENGNKKEENFRFLKRNKRRNKWSKYSYNTRTDSDDSIIKYLQRNKRTTDQMQETLGKRVRKKFFPKRKPKQAVNIIHEEENGTFHTSTVYKPVEDLHIKKEKFDFNDSDLESMYSTSTISSLSSSCSTESERSRKNRYIKRRKRFQNALNMLSRIKHKTAIDFAKERNDNFDFFAMQFSNQNELEKENDDKYAMPTFPRLLKLGYSTNPPLRKMCDLSISQLQNVLNFEVSNKYGLIRMLGNINLIGKDLDEIEINSDRVVVDLPEFKNVPCMIIKYSVDLEKKLELDDWVKNNSKATFIDYKDFQYTYFLESL